MTSTIPYTNLSDRHNIHHLPYLLSEIKNVKSFILELQVRRSTGIVNVVKTGRPSVHVQEVVPDEPPQMTSTEPGPTGSLNRLRETITSNIGTLSLSRGTRVGLSLMVLMSVPEPVDGG